MFVELLIKIFLFFILTNGIFLKIQYFPSKKKFLWKFLIYNFQFIEILGFQFWGFEIFLIC